MEDFDHSRSLRGRQTEPLLFFVFLLCCRREARERSITKQLKGISTVSEINPLAAIDIRAIFLPEGAVAVDHLPKKFLQVAQIFTKQSKRNEGQMMH